MHHLRSNNVETLHRLLENHYIFSMSSSSSRSRIDQVQDYVERFVSDKFPVGICYHNIDHIYDVVEGCRIIGRDCNVNGRDMELLEAAAWLHDLGYYAGYVNHEAVSASLAQEFLLKNGWSEEEVEIIRNCILSTKVPQNPTTQLEEIICDADLFHLGLESFFQKSELLRLELTLHDRNISQENWLKQSLKFLEVHEFHTEYGKVFLNKRKNENYGLLTSKIGKI